MTIVSGHCLAATPLAGEACGNAPGPAARPRDQSSDISDRHSLQGVAPCVWSDSSDAPKCALSEVNAFFVFRADYREKVRVARGARLLQIISAPSRHGRREGHVGPRLDHEIKRRAGRSRIIGDGLAALL